MPSEYVELGDHLYLQETTGKGWLHGSGRPDFQRSSGLAPVYVDPYEPRLVRMSIFVIQHQQNWSHLRTLQLALERAGLTRRQAENDPKYTELFANAQRECNLNERDLEQARGRVVRYGMVVQLLHATSQAFLHVSSTPSETDPLSSCVLATDKEAGSSGWFRVTPKLQQVHREGERVHVGDPCILEQVDSGVLIGLGPLSDGRAMYEVLGSLKVNISFKLMRYRGHAEVAGTQAEGSMDLFSGSVVHVMHKEAQGCIGIESGTNALSVLESDADSKAAKSGNGCIVLERLEAHDGSACKWTEAFRMRHLATGRLLCLHPTSGTTVTAPPGTDQPTSSTTGVLDRIEAEDMEADDSTADPSADSPPAAASLKMKLAGAAKAKAGVGGGKPSEGSQQLQLRLADMEERRGNAATLGDTTFQLQPL